MTELYKVNLILLKIKLLIGEGKCSFEEQREKKYEDFSRAWIIAERCF